MAHYVAQLKARIKELEAQVAASGGTVTAGPDVTADAVGDAKSVLDPVAFYEKLLVHWATTDLTMLDPVRIGALKGAAGDLWLTLQDLIGSHDRVVADAQKRRDDAAAAERRKAAEAEARAKIEAARRAKPVSAPIVQVQRQGVYTPEEQALIDAAMSAGVGAPVSNDVDLPAPVA